MIKLRIDVDYPYPSRLRGLIYTALQVKIGHDYLKNSKILARMINDSPKEVKAYWFFTLKTIPDEELLRILDDEKHEVALHVVNNPYEEMELLEKTTKRRIRYYTIHGTSRLLGRIIWKRLTTKAPVIPQNFSLQSFHKVPTFVLDSYCHTNSTSKAVEVAKDSIAQGKVLEVHPDWLFLRGTINHRGPYYEVLRRILNVDEEFEGLVRRKKLFVRIARSAWEYEKDFLPTETFVERLREIGVDIFTFIERKWHHTFSHPQKSWIKADDNVAILKVTNYDEWWKSIGKKTRNMVRKADKMGVSTDIVTPDFKLAEGIWKIYNETPIRQGRAFWYYGVTLETVKRLILSTRNSAFIGSYVEDELAGFIRLIHGDNIAIISQIMSLQKQWNKAINNALLAKAIEVCANQQVKWLMYGRMGNHPSLDRFKQNNGFNRLSLTRYYIPLTKKGKIATKLGLHRDLKDALPELIKPTLISIYNWISRTKAKSKLQSQS